MKINNNYTNSYNSAQTQNFKGLNPKKIKDMLKFNMAPDDFRLSKRIKSKPSIFSQIKLATKKLADGHKMTMYLNKKTNSFTTEIKSKDKSHCIKTTIFSSEKLSADAIKNAKKEARNNKRSEMAFLKEIRAGATDIISARKTGEVAHTKFTRDENGFINGIKVQTDSAINTANEAQMVTSLNRNTAGEISGFEKTAESARRKDAKSPMVYTESSMTGKNWDKSFTERIFDRMKSIMDSSKKIVKTEEVKKDEGSKIVATTVKDLIKKTGVTTETKIVEFKL